MISSEEFIEKFEKIPPKIQDLLASDKFPQEIEDILTLTNTDLKYFEPIIDALEEILLLKKSKDSLEKEIQEKTGLPLQKVQIISDLIRKRILALVEEELNLFSPSLNFLENLPEKNEISSEITETPTETPKEELVPPKTTITEEPIIKTPPINPSPTPSSTLDKENLEISTQKETLEKPFEESKGKSEKESPPQQLITPPKRESIKREEEIEIPKIPEPQPVIVEKPLDKTKELKKVKIPTIKEEDQEKIKERLLKIMTEKKSTASPKILEEMKKISETGMKTEKTQETPLQTHQKGYSYFEEKKEPVSFAFEESEKFIPEEETEPKTKKTEKIPPIIGAKIKEFKKEKEI